MTAIEQVERLLAEIPYCLTHQGVSLAQIARQFGTTPEQVEADLKLAWTCELPDRTFGTLLDLDVDALDEGAAVYISYVDTLDQPLRMTAAEAVSLQLALSMISDTASSSLSRAISSLQEKIAAISVDASMIADVSVESGTPEVRETLAKAISSAQRVTLTYDGENRGITTHPTVDPAKITVRDGVTYLLAYAVDRSAWRTYRVDRIAEVVLTGVDSQSHGDVDLDSWARDLTSGSVVTIDCTQEAARIAEVYSHSTPEPLGDGLIRVKISVVTPAWMVRLLMRLGAGAVLVTPSDYAERARTEARQALEAYSAMGMMRKTHK